MSDQLSIIRMAREAGFEYSGKELTWESVICTEELERFAELVRADEREACAKVCDELDKADETFYRELSDASVCAAAIRARGQA
jgi:hypothetical protein